MTGARAIVFDLDDTLYPERAYAFSGFRAVADAFAETLGPATAVAARMRDLFDTPDRSRIFDLVIAESDPPDPAGLLEEMIHTYRTHAPAIALYPDADAALTRLRSRCKLGVITDGPALAQHAKLDALGVGTRVDEVIVTDDWGASFWKPHPRAFVEMARRLGVPAERCTYVADNVAKDFVAPNALGWHTVQIDRPNAVHAHQRPPRGGDPDRAITTLDAL